MSAALRNGPVCQVYACGGPAAPRAPGNDRKRHYRPFCYRHWRIYIYTGAVTILRECDPL